MNTACGTSQASERSLLSVMECIVKTLYGANGVASVIEGKLNGYHNPQTGESAKQPEVTIRSLAYIAESLASSLESSLTSISNSIDSSTTTPDCSPSRLR